MANYGGPPPGYGPPPQYQQPPQGYGYPPQGPPPPRPKSVFSGVLLALIVFFIVLPIGGLFTCAVCAGVAREHAKDTAIGTAKPRPPTRNEPSPTSPPPEPDPPGSFRDGSLVVGTDVAPGTYRTREAGRGCYWARLAGFSGELGDTLANGNETGPMIITIGKSDKGFESKRCGLWVPDLSAITEGPSEPFGDGTYIVGTDIAPGTWRNDSPQGCYWSRLRGFSGQMGDLITNANGKGIVTIAATDRGFKSHRCGTWSKS